MCSGNVHLVNGPQFGLSFFLSCFLFPKNLGKYFIPSLSEFLQIIPILYLKPPLIHSVRSFFHLKTRFFSLLWTATILFPHLHAILLLHWKNSFSMFSTCLFFSYAIMYYIKIIVPFTCSMIASGRDVANWFYFMQISDLGLNWWIHYCCITPSVESWQIVHQYCHYPVLPQHSGII